MNSERVRQRMSDDACCRLCGAAEEDLSHLIWGCVEARLLWSQLIKREKLDEFYSLDFVHGYSQISATNNNSLPSWRSGTLFLVLFFGIFGRIGTIDSLRRKLRKYSSQKYGECGGV
ncbi:hypothetical protein V6N12_070219 [Hibiscus sabdariffa]